MRQINVNGYVWILLATLLWSLLGFISKFCMQAGMQPLETGFWRAAIGCAFFMAHAALTGGLRIPLRHALIFMLFGTWGIGVFFGAMQMAIKLSGGATAVVLHDLTLASRFCHQVCVLQQGRIQAHGQPSQVLDDTLLRQVFGLQALRLQQLDADCIVPWEVLT